MKEFGVKIFLFLLLTIWYGNHNFILFSLLPIFAGISLTNFAGFSKKKPGNIPESPDFSYIRQAYIY